MRSADIEVGRDYRVDAGYEEFVQVTVLATREQWRQDGRRQWRTDGVRVRLCEPAGRLYTRRGGYRHERGEEIVLASRQVVRAWTAEDDVRRAAADVEENRKQYIERRLGEEGYAKDEIGAEGDYEWRGDWLMLSPKLTAELFELAGI